MSLEPEALCAAACEATGLDDFGGDSFREGLEVLTASIRKDGELTEAGLEGARNHFIHLLSMRLRIEDFYREHPEIDDQEVPEPVFMLGLPRTGSTALGALLQCDPERRSLLVWESDSPIPPPEAATRNTDPRIAAAQAAIDARIEAAPKLATIQMGSATQSTECFNLFGMEFRTQHFSAQYKSPDYYVWSRDCDMVPAYQYHRRVLKLLQWHCGPNRWHLHCPLYALSLNDLEKVYPDARFLMTHRDPAKVMASACSFIEVVMTLFSGAPVEDIRKMLGAENVETWTIALQRALDFRATREDRFADIYFQDLNADPIGSIEKAYTKLGLPFTEEARTQMTAWSKSHRRGQHGMHRYRLEDYGLEANRVREAFSFYFERCGVTVED